MKLILKLLVPWLAVGICWCVLKNGWLAILTYHAQVLFWNRESLAQGWNAICERVPSVPGGHTPPFNRRWLFAALPTLLTGPLVCFLLPYITSTDLDVWLAEYKLTGVSLLLMIPYFGIVHPMLEQLH